MKLLKERPFHRFTEKLRASPSKEAEDSTVNEELARLRVSLQTMTDDGWPTAVTILAYACTLGYSVAFADDFVEHMLRSEDQPKKLAGYFAASVVFDGRPDAVTKAAKIVKADLKSSNVVLMVACLHFIAACGTAQVTQELFADVASVANPGRAFPPIVRKKAYACMLRCVRYNPSLLPASEWSARLSHCLSSEHDVGTLLALAALIQGALEVDARGWEDCIPSVIDVLVLIAKGKLSDSAIYKGVPAPWLYVKYLRLLRLFPANLAKAHIRDVGHVIRCVFEKQRQADIQASSTQIFVTLEAIHLVVHYQEKLDVKFRRQAAVILGDLMSSRDLNVRLLGIVAVRQLSFDSSIVRSLCKHTAVLMRMLDESDALLQQNAVSLLCAISGPSNWRAISDGILDMLRRRPTCPVEAALKVVSLVEMFSNDSKSYVDFVFRTCDAIPESLTDDVWFRMTQVLTGFVGDKQDLGEVRAYAAKRALESLQTTTNAMTVRLCSCLLGEFGKQAGCDSAKMIDVMLRHLARSYGLATFKSQVAALLKVAATANGHERQRVVGVLEQLKSSTVADLQQRALEGLALLESGHASMLAPNPKYPASARLANPLVTHLGHDKLVNSRLATHLSMRDAPKETPSSSRDDFVRPKKSASRKTPLPLKTLSGIDDSHGLWLNAVLRGFGTLFANSALHIEVKALKTAKTGLSFRLLVSNVTGKSALRVAGFTVSTLKAATAFDLVGMSASSSSSATVAMKPSLQTRISLSPGESTAVACMVSMTSWAECPRLRSSVVSTSGSFAFDVALPVALSRAVTPMAIAERDVGQEWAKLSHQQLASGSAPREIDLGFLHAEFGFQKITYGGYVWFAGEACGERVMLCTDVKAKSRENVRVAVRSSHESFSRRVAEELKMILFD